MVKLRLLKSVSSLSLVLFSSVTFLPLALGHAQIQTADHVVKSPREFVAIESTASEVHKAVANTLVPNNLVGIASLSRLLLKLQVDTFELGNGKRIFVFPSSDFSQAGLLAANDASSTFFTVEPKKLLVFVESKKAIAARPLVRGIGMIKGLYVLTPEQTHELYKDPFNYVHVLSISPQAPQNRFVAPEQMIPAQDALLENSLLQQFLRGDFVSQLGDTVLAQGRSSPIVSERLMKDVRVLSGEDTFSDPGKSGTQVRITERGSVDGRELTQRYLVSQFEAAGAKAKTWCYQSGRGKGCNVLAGIVNPGAKETLVLSSHLDSVRNAGADDNASGSAALLELARVFAKQRLTVNIAFVAFDQEELGLVGSAAMAKEIASLIPGTYLANINTDMIGYDSDSDGVIHAMDCGRDDSLWLTKAAGAAIKGWSLPLSVKEACTNRSDHASFWRVAKAATIFSENFFGGDENRCYHQKCDKIDLINESYFKNMVSLMYGSAMLISEGIERFRQLNEPTSSEQ
jgi:hypothetical protein